MALSYMMNEQFTWQPQMPWARVVAPRKLPPQQRGPPRWP